MAGSFKEFIGVHDSYEPFEKLVNQTPLYAKRIYVAKKDTKKKKSCFLKNLFGRKLGSITANDPVLNLYISMPFFRPQIEALFPKLIFDKSERLAFCAERNIGLDRAKTQNEFGCAEAVNTIAEECIGEPIGGDVSTYRVYAPPPPKPPPPKN